MKKYLSSTRFFEEDYMNHKMQYIKNILSIENLEKLIRKIYPNFKQYDNNTYVSYELFLFDCINNLLPVQQQSNQDIIIECYMIEKLLAMSKLSMNETIYKTRPVLFKMKSLVEEFGPYHLIEMFHKKEYQYEMVKLFVDFEYRNDNQNNIHLSIDDKTRLEFYYATKLYQREIYKKVFVLIKKIDLLLENEPIWNLLSYVETKEYQLLVHEIKEYRKLGFDDINFPYEMIEKMLKKIHLYDIVKLTNEIELCNNQLKIKK